jgi:riboflavin synthase
VYTGIVQAMLPISAVENKTGLMTFHIDLAGELSVDLETGASVAVNGVCFTVTEIVGDSVSFDAMQETLDITNIDKIEPGTLVNIERSAKAGVEIGGHILSGHIVDVAIVTDVEDSENNKRITFQGKPEWMKYVFHKGFLALNGASLTVASVDRELNQFSVNLIPETLKRTNFDLMAKGDQVNVEVDQQTQVIVDTITNLVKEGMLENMLPTAAAEKP